VSSLTAPQTKRMSLRWYTVVVDCHDVRAQGHWWATALDWQIVHEADDEMVTIPGWVDLAPHTSQDRDAEIARLIEMGARRIDVGQDESDATRTVLADPEGNEFCVLSSHDQ